MMVKKAVDRYLKDKSPFSALFNPLNVHSGKCWFSLKHHFVGWQLCVNVDVLLEGMELLNVLQNFFSSKLSVVDQTPVDVRKKEC